jgi:hypothetical protein
MQIDLAFNLSGIYPEIQLHPPSCHRRRAMNSLFHAEESSLTAAKRIAVVVAGMGLLGLALWAGAVMALRVASGR